MLETSKRRCARKGNDMPRRSRAMKMGTPIRIAAVTVAVTLIVGGSPAASNLQPAATANPLTQQEVESALKALTPRRIASLIRERGTTFILNIASEPSFRAVATTEGVDPALVEDIIRLVAPPKNPSTGAEWSAPTDGRQMVFIPAGAFQMGSPNTEPGREPDEALHSVTMSTGFWLESTEVTYRAFQKFVLANPDWQKSRIDAQWHDGNYLADWTGNTYPPGKADAPVVNVSWYAAQAYARWAGKRLPSEAEWEYAARAGTRTAYWWGNSFDAGSSADTGKHPWGLSGMLGGVWEWTSSVYDDYPFPTNGSRETAGPVIRVIRGGAGTSGPAILRSANRNRDASVRSSDILGFRCALQTGYEKQQTK